MTPACLERTVAVYEEICDEVVAVSSPEAAELSKLLENIFRSVNIALVNELAQLTDRLDIDIWEVIDASSTKPFGFMRFEPGPGMGGHCLPVDPFYLAFKAREHNFATEFVELAGKINQSHPLFCVSKIQRALNDREKSVKGSRILIVGVAYKSGVADLREAPALKIIAALRELGAEVEYHDPHVPALPDQGLESVELDPRRRRRRRRRDRHRPRRARLPGARRAAPRSSSTSAASPGRWTPTTSSCSDRGRRGCPASPPPATPKLAAPRPRGAAHEGPGDHGRSPPRARSSSARSLAGSAAGSRSAIPRRSTCSGPSRPWRPSRSPDRPPRTRCWSPSPATTPPPAARPPCSTCSRDSSAPRSSSASRRSGSARAGGPGTSTSAAATSTTSCPGS